jgi:hypothetical protein
MGLSSLMDNFIACSIVAAPGRRKAGAPAVDGAPAVAVDGAPAVTGLLIYSFIIVNSFSITLNAYLQK